MPCHPYAAAVAKSLQSCPTLCDPRDGSPPGSPVPGILQARMLEWVAISFFNAWKWKVKVKSLSRVWLFQPHGLQPSRLLCPWDFPGKSTGVGCHCLLRKYILAPSYSGWSLRTQGREHVQFRGPSLRELKTTGRVDNAPFPYSLLPCLQNCCF